MSPDRHAGVQSIRPTSSPQLSAISSELDHSCAQLTTTATFCCLCIIQSFWSRARTTLLLQLLLHWISSTASSEHCAFSTFVGFIQFLSCVQSICCVACTRAPLFTSFVTRLLLLPLVFLSSCLSACVCVFYLSHCVRLPVNRSARNWFIILAAAVSLVIAISLCSMPIQLEVIFSVGHARHRHRPSSIVKSFRLFSLFRSP